MNALKRLIHEIHRRSLWQVLGIYAVSGWIAFEVVQTLTEGLGLPEWFPPFALILLIIGLPIVMATAFVQEGGPEEEPGKEEEEGSVLRRRDGALTSRLLTWKNALLGGVGAFVLLGVGAAGWVLLGGGRLAGPPEIPESSATPEQSVAVLPFENMSGNPENEYFSDGITEELLNALAGIPGLRVPGRTTSFAFKDRNLTIQQIADTLDVAHVLEGSVRWAGDRLRITAQLVEARTDTHLWSETYDRELADVFAIQEEIARSITDALNVRLFGDRSTALVRQGTRDPEAYNLYLQGRQLWHQRGAENQRSALDYFQQAVARDRGFARAHAAMAEAHVLGSADAGMSVEGFRQARQAARRALELDSAMAPAHGALGFAHLALGEWQEAASEFRRALALDSDYATGHHWYCLHHAFLGRLDQALEECRRAVEIDPTYSAARTNVAEMLAWQRRYDEAVAEYRRVLELDPSFARARDYRLVAYALMGDTARALEEAERAVTLGWAGNLASAYVFARFGRPDRAREILLATADRDPIRPTWRAQVHIALGAPDRALDLLEDGLREAIPFQLRKVRSPTFDPVRQDPRFQAVLRELGLPEGTSQ